MELTKKMLALLDTVYEPDTVIERRLGHHDLMIKTDAVGDPVLLFLVKITRHGTTKTERYARRVITDAAGLKAKQVWEIAGDDQPDESLFK